MKKLAIIIGAAAVAGIALAYSPTYLSTSARSQSVPGAIATGTNAFAIFRSSAQAQIRVISVIGSADTNTAAFNFYSGTTPHTITVATNPAAATNIVLESTAGIPTGTSAWLLFEPVSASPFVALCYSTNNATNLVLYAAPQNALAVGDQVYVLGTPTSLPCVSGTLQGGTNVAYASEALFVGNSGRGVVIRLNGSVTNWISTASARYE